MALRLQFLTVVITRAAIAKCQGAPAFFSELNTDAGILMGTNWYDANLYCETAMSGFDVSQMVEDWKNLGLVSAQICVAASGRGPSAPCGWLDYSPDDNCVWLKGSEKGEIIGGEKQITERHERIEAARAKGERAYSAMYDSRSPKDEYDDAHMALSEALKHAKFLHLSAETEQLAARIEQIRAIYQAQFRGF